MVSALEFQETILASLLSKILNGPCIKNGDGDEKIKRRPNKHLVWRGEVPNLSRLAKVSAAKARH
jgi:hypothetical protein